MRELLHREAIAELIHTYARNVRHGRGIDCVELFTDGGTFEIRDCPLDGNEEPATRARLVGHGELSDYLARGDGAAARVCPVIGNLIIHIDGNRARANSVMTATVWPDGKRLLGEYEDHFILDGAWRFSSRRFDILGEFPA